MNTTYMGLSMDYAKAFGQAMLSECPFYAGQ